MKATNIEEKKRNEIRRIDVELRCVVELRSIFEYLFNFALLCCAVQIAKSNLWPWKNGAVGGAAEQMDECDERLAIPMVCVGGKFGPAVLLHVQGENDERRSTRVRAIEGRRHWHR